MAILVVSIILLILGLVGSYFIIVMFAGKEVRRGQILKDGKWIDCSSYEYEIVSDDQRRVAIAREGNYPIRWLSLLAGPLLAGIVLLSGSFATVGANEVGIIYDQLNGGVLEETYGQGLHFKSVFRKVTNISTSNRTSYLEVYSQTEDSINALFEITVIYKIGQSNAGLFYRTTGKVDISPEQLNSVIKKNIQSVTTKHNIFDIMGESLETVRTEFKDALYDDLYRDYHITLVSVSIDDVDAGDEIERIIQDKAKAIQQIEIAEQEKQRVEVEALTAIIRAENEAEVAKIRAEGNAEAQIILNSVTVNAIKQMYVLQFEESQDTSTPEVYGYLTIQEIAEVIITQLYYDVWDGVLPTVVTDGSGIIIQP